MMMNNQNMMDNLNVIQKNEKLIDNDSLKKKNHEKTADDSNITKDNSKINDNIKNENNKDEKEENIEKLKSKKNQNEEEKIVQNKISENEKLKINSSEEITFNDKMKKELKKMVNDIILKFLDGKSYVENQAQSWSNDISDEIIKELNKQNRGLTFICSTTIFQRTNSSLNFSSTCLWKPGDDGSITVKYEKDEIYCFVFLAGIKK